MLLLPLLREGRGIRRVPWASVALVAINVVALLAISVGGDDAALVQRVGEVLSFLREHPYLDPSPRVTRRMGEGFAEEVARARLAAGAGGVPSIEVFERERLELERREQGLLDALRNLPDQRLGFTPARPWSAGLISSLFVHGGWLHLLGNLLFLWITAPFLEERLGRALFVGFYLACGLAANAAHALRYPQSDVPLVGASGAIAGLMGAFLVYFWSTRLRFLVIPTPVTVSLPALVVLPLWLVEQMWYARYAGEEVGIAFTAHVGGFLFGLAAAFVMSAAGLGAAPKEEDDGGSDGEELRAAYEAALESEDPARISEAGLRLLQQLQAAGAIQEALDFIADARRSVPAPVPPRLWQACAGLLERHDVTEALGTYQELIESHPSDPASLRALMRRGDLLRRQGDAVDARRAYEQARNHPACTPTAREAIERSLAQLGRG